MPSFAPKQVVVDGEAVLEFEPEVFRLASEIHARGEDKQAVLTEISETLNRIRVSLPALEGLTHLDIRSESVTLKPVYESDCAERYRYSAHDSCAVAGYSGEISLSIRGAPAELAGSALSYLSELGAERVALVSYELVDRNAAKQKAIDAAVGDARKKAASVALASGAEIKRLLQVQYGDGLRDYFGREEQTISVSAPRAPMADMAAPEVDLILNPVPIWIRAEVVAAFEIE